MGIKQLLEGKKTYIVALVAAAIEFAKYSGVIELSPDQEQMIWAVLGALGLSTMRAGMKK